MVPDKGEVIIELKRVKGNANMMNMHSTTCSFDGEKLTFLGIGNSLIVKQGRGFSEPSIVKFDGKWFLTIRSDKSAFAATSEDGFHFGHFGVTQVSHHEVWAVSSEYHRDESPENKNRVWVAIIK